MKYRLSLFILMTVLATVFGPLALAVSTWPADSSGVEIGSGVRALYPALEPSGLVWHSGRNQLMGVGDEGQVFAMNADGTGAVLWQTSGDLEDITVVDTSSGYVFLADEDGRIIKFDLSSGSVVQTWSVTAWLPEVDCDGNPSTTSTCGMEALTYADGYFYAGYQLNGTIFKLDLSGNTASKVAEFRPVSSGISGLNYKDGYLYALYNSTMAVLDLDGNLKTTYPVPGVSQEGLALGVDSNGDGDANMFIAQDGSSYRIYSYDNFPLYGWTAPAPVVTDPDNDGDGAAASVDCNDTDASVSAYQTFYVDADYDGNGSRTTASLCTTVAPYGYSSNSVDTYDAIPNAGVEVSNDRIDNDLDGRTDEHNTVALNGYHPYFSLLDPNTSYRGKITGYWGLKNGEVGIRFADWSVYRYQPFAVRSSSFTQITPITGTAYFTVTLNGQSFVINGYNGFIR